MNADAEPKAQDKCSRLRSLVPTREVPATPRASGLSNEWGWESWVATHGRMASDRSSRCKTNAKWTEDPSLRAKAIKLVEENVGEKSLGHRVWQWFLKYSTNKHRQNKETNWTPSKLKTGVYQRMLSRK